ncbi:MAG: hypothetical protein JWN71_586 [Xanthobacteraceae bacterium]|nr:hypothetical protein [Xanthobacteraceae bacterium]
MKKIILGAMAVCMAGPALAADLPRAYPVKAAPVAALPSWAGFYIGVHGGYGRDPISANVTPSGLLTPLGLDNNGGSGPFGLTAEPDGGFGGFQIGYNWQFGRWVLGLEADASFGSIKDSASGSFFQLTDDVIGAGGDAVRIDGTATLERKIEAFGTVRGRIGFAMTDSMLLYGTGGLAWANVKSSLAIGNIALSGGGAINFTPGQFTHSASESSTEIGYAIGGGLDWALTSNLWLRGEYMFLGFGEAGNQLTIPGAATTDRSLSMHVARVGLNYRFAGP